MDEDTSILIGGVVSARDFKPYIQIMVDGHLVQLTVAEARSVARDIEVKCARTEADAMIHFFFRTKQFPPGASDQLMVEFRDFRSSLDKEPVDTGDVAPGE
jgi:hypothetical protein